MYKSHLVQLHGRNNNKKILLRAFSVVGFKNPITQAGHY